MKRLTNGYGEIAKTTLMSAVMILSSICAFAGNDADFSKTIVERKVQELNSVTEIRVKYIMAYLLLNGSGMDGWGALAEKAEIEIAASHLKSLRKAQSYGEIENAFALLPLDVQEKLADAATLN